MKKFDDVEIEKDTKIISVKYINIEGVRFGIGMELLLIL